MTLFSKDLLAGRRALVTGAGTGIGRAVALELAAHGADVVLAARRRDRLEETAARVRALGRAALVASTDVADAAQVKALVDRAEAELGPLDVLVNNAAANFVRPSERLTPVRWRKVVDIVLNGTFHCTLEAGRRMLERGSGRIVNLVAAYAWTGAPGLLPSACAKAGVVAMTRTLGVEWASRGVRVNALAPGFVDTEQSHALLWPEPGMSERILSKVPAGRFGTIAEVASVVLWLASPAADYLCGEVVVADGGHSLGKGALELLGGAVRRPKARTGG